jgi:hypothetical protein
MDKLKAIKFKTPCEFIMGLPRICQINFFGKKILGISI